MVGQDDLGDVDALPLPPKVQQGNEAAIVNGGSKVGHGAAQN